MVFAVPVADMVTFRPMSGFPLASLTVMVMVDAAVPSATAEVAVICEVEAEGMGRNGDQEIIWSFAELLVRRV